MPLAGAALPWVIGGAAAAGAGASIYAANKGAKVSQAATDQTLALNREQAAQSRADAMPYIQAGYGATNAITGRLGLPTTQAADPNGALPNAITTSTGTGVSPGTYGNVTNPTYTAPTYNAPADYQSPAPFKFDEGDFKNSDAYKFAMDRGTEAIRAKQAYLGALDSGDTGKELATFAQGLASQQFADERAFARTAYDSDRAFGRNTYDLDRNFGRSAYESDRGFNRGVYGDDRDYMTGRYDRETGNLFNLAQLGQAAAAGQSAAGQNYTANATNAITSNASNRINAGLATSSSINNLIGQGINGLSYYYGSRR